MEYAAWNTGSSHAAWWSDPRHSAAMSAWHPAQVSSAARRSLEDGCPLACGAGPGSRNDGAAAATATAATTDAPTEKTSGRGGGGRMTGEGTPDIAGFVRGEKALHA